MSEGFVGSVLGMVGRHVMHWDGRSWVDTIRASNTLVSVRSLLSSNTTSVVTVAVWRAARAAADTEEPEESSGKGEEATKPVDGEHASSDVSLDIKRPETCFNSSDKDTVENGGSSCTTDGKYCGNLVEHC